MKHVLSAVCLLSVAACGSARTVAEGSFSFRGKTYPTVTQDITTRDRTFQRRTILVGVRRVGCSATDDRDCRQEIIEALKSNADRGGD